MIMLKWIGVVGIKTIVLDDYFFPSPLDYAQISDAHEIMRICHIMISNS